MSNSKFELHWKIDLYIYIYIYKECFLERKKICFFTFFKIVKPPLILKV